MAATIKHVTFYGEQSAEVTISDGIHECVAHSFPCEAVVGDLLSEPLATLDVENCMLADSTKSGFIRLDAWSFEYRVTAYVLDASNGIVSVGDIEIDVGHLPGGIQSGDMISFDCPRIDLN